jgi:hypothetical protein
LRVGLETADASDTVTFPVQALELREQVHVLNALEALVMEIELLVELESAVVLLPVLLEEIQDPFARAAHNSAVFVLLVLWRLI